MLLHIRYVAPYVVDEKRLAAFIEKYPPPRPLTEREQLEIIVQLGIYDYAPQWLKPAAKLKIEAMIREQGSKRAGELQPLVFASNEELIHNWGIPTMSDVAPSSLQVAVLDSLPNIVRSGSMVPLFAGGGAAAATAWGSTAIATGAAIAASPVTTAVLLSAAVGLGLIVSYAAIKQYLVPAIAEAWDKKESEECNSGGVQCTVEQIPQEKVIVPGQGGKQKCDEPPDPPMYCYRYDSNPNGTGAFCLDTGQKSKTHYNVYPRNNAGNGKCYWNKTSATHAYCHRENIPTPNAPCSSFPSFR